MNPDDLKAAPSTHHTVVCSLVENGCPITRELFDLNAEVNDLRKQVITDPLTKLFNRRHMQTCLEQEIERTQRSGQPTSIALIDLDHFKKVNDTHGHTVGDDVLRSIADVIYQTIRKLDIACRYGGEEFCIIFPGSFPLVASQVAERVRKAIEAVHIISGDVTLQVTASFGIASYSNTSRESITEFLTQADEQLYKAKKEGRNQVMCKPEIKSNPAHVSAEEKDALFNILNN